MRGRGQHLLDGSTLDDPPEVHHGDPVGDVPRQPQIVGDDQGRQSEIVPHRSSRAKISPRTEASSEATGSSAIRTLGVERQSPGD